MSLLEMRNQFYLSIRVDSVFGILELYKLGLGSDGNIEVLSLTMKKDFQRDISVIRDRQELATIADRKDRLQRWKRNQAK